MNTNSNPRWTVIAVAMLAVALTAFFVLRKPQEQLADAAPPGADSGGIVPFRMEQQWLIHLKMAVAEEARMAPQIRSVGRVIAKPSNRAVVAPPVGGIIQTGTMPRIGQQVAGGQVIATLLQTPTAAEAAQIRIENTRIEADRRRLQQAEVEAKARADEAAHDAERAERLYERKAYSAKALEFDVLNRKTAEAQLAAVREQLMALQSAPAASTTYEVHSPIAGTVVSVSKAAGEQVAPGEAILEVIALDTVWVQAPVFEKDLGRLNKNIQAVFTTAAFPDKELTGRLINVGSVIDEQTRAADAIFEVNNRSGELRIGMQANVRVSAGNEEQVLLVPREAIVDNEGQKIVYVMKSGETFERRNVVLGDEYGAKVTILSGIKPGERVVTQGAYQLKLQELKPANAGAHTHEV
jgi:membrane fusion protein, heavy metal efflux system